MQIAHRRIQELAKDAGLSLSVLLRRAGVSRTAYYALARKRSIFPRSLTAIAAELDVPVGELLRESGVDPATERRLATARGICARHPTASFENVWHTLCLLELQPIDRLNRGLTRGRAGTVQR